AHEVASEAFTRLWARWASVAEPRGFLYVTAANLVRDHWRKLERERRAVHRATAEAVVGPRNEQTDPSVRLLVQSLPERLRVPIGVGVACAVGALVVVALRSAAPQAPVSPVPPLAPPPASGPSAGPSTSASPERVSPRPRRSGRSPGTSAPSSAPVPTART